MPLGGLLPYGDEQGAGLMGMMKTMGPVPDFNAQARQLAGPMPALPQFDFSPISISGSGGGSTPNQGALNDASPPSGTGANQPNPNTGTVYTPPTVGGNPNLPQPNNGTGSFQQPYTYTPHSYPNVTFDNGMGTPGTPAGEVDQWGNAINGAMLGGMLGPVGMIAGGILGYNADGTPATPSTPPTPLDQVAITEEELAGLLADPDRPTSGGSTDSRETNSGVAGGGSFLADAVQRLGIWGGGPERIKR